MTSPSSPLRGILGVIADNTTLVEMNSGTPKGTLDQAKKNLGNKLSGILKPMEEAVGLPSIAAGTSVTVHYQWVRQLTGGEAGKTRLDAILNAIAEIQKQIDALGPGVADRSPLEILPNPSFRASLQALREQATSVPPPISKLITEMAAVARGCGCNDRDQRSGRRVYAADRARLQHVDRE